MSEAKRWMEDQPFSSRPAILGSSLASVHLDDHVEAIRSARQGLLSNPDDFVLQNNLAFSLALNGDVKQADQVSCAIDEDGLPELLRMAITATRGLVAFRSGHPVLGRSLYRSAINQGRQLRDPIRECLARIYYAFEELHLNPATAKQACAEAFGASKVLVSPSHRATAEKLRMVSS